LAEIFLHHGDLPDGVQFGAAVAVDCETMGLRHGRDRLCLVQLSAGDGKAHLVQFAPHVYEAPRLTALMADPKVTKIFHFARFDLAAMRKYLGVRAAPVFCTRIASKLVRTFTDQHSLKTCCKELLDIDLSKAQQSSDWGAPVLTDAQKAYAASDVLHLHALMGKFQALLARENRLGLAQACFDFLPDRAELDLAGWPDEDIFAH